MNKNEINLLTDENFVSKIVNFSHKDIIERIAVAELDINKNMSENDPSDEFVKICENIINVNK